MCDSCIVRSMLCVAMAHVLHIGVKHNLVSEISRSVFGCCCFIAQSDTPCLALQVSYVAWRPQHPAVNTSKGQTWLGGWTGRNRGIICLFWRWGAVLVKILHGFITRHVFSLVRMWALCWRLASVCVFMKSFVVRVYVGHVNLDVVALSVRWMVLGSVSALIGPFSSTLLHAWSLISDE